MFGFEKHEAAALGSEGRYEKRVEKFRAAGKSFPRVRHYFWWVLHNAMAHGGLAIWPCRATFRFHDWTSIRLNAGIENLEDYKAAAQRTAAYRAEKQMQEERKK